ncbi:MAG: regulatory protein RecX [Bacteroidota bacterium]
MQKKYLSKADALKRMQRYCAYQDRCHSEVRSKLIELGVYGDTLEEIMAELIIERFLDEERFARSYVRGKFRLKKWGRIRIKRELKLRKISAYCQRKGLEEIEEAAYQKTLREILQKKLVDYGRKYNAFESGSKAATYAQGRGYETALIWPIIKELQQAQAEANGE